MIDFSLPKYTSFSYYPQISKQEPEPAILRGQTIFKHFLVTTFLYMIAKHEVENKAYILYLGFL